MEPLSLEVNCGDQHCLVGPQLLSLASPQYPNSSAWGPPVKAIASCGILEVIPVSQEPRLHSDSIACCLFVCLFLSKTHVAATSLGLLEDSLGRGNLGCLGTEKDMLLELSGLCFKSWLCVVLVGDCRKAQLPRYQATWVVL